MAKARKGSPGPAPPGAEFDVRVAWRRDDPEIEADAVAFWDRLGIMPPGVRPEDRAKELIAAAYCGDRLAAVSTAALDWIEPLRARMAVIRGATDPEYRRSHAQLALAVPSREALVSWSIAHPEEKLAGGIAFVDRAEWGDFSRLPVWPGSELSLAGHDEQGRQVRVSWFEHFRFDGAPDPKPLPSSPAVTPPDIEFRPAWRLGDPAIEADAIDFWNRLNILRTNVTPEARAKELVLVAYRNGRIAGVVTADVGVFPQVRARVAMVRGAVDPDLRRSHIGFAMLLSASQILESWSAEHPHERLAGIGGILESRELVAAQSQPYWPQSRLGLIGFTPDGRQIRVAWFPHAKYD